MQFIFLWMNLMTYPNQLYGKNEKNHIMFIVCIEKIYQYKAIIIYVSYVQCWTFNFGHPIFTLEKASSLASLNLITHWWATAQFEAYVEDLKVVMLKALVNCFRQTSFKHLTNWDIDKTMHQMTTDQILTVKHASYR